MVSKIFSKFIQGKTANYLLYGLFIWLFSMESLLGKEPAQKTLTEDLYFSELPIVITPTRLQQPLDEAPTSVTIIDRDMIESSSALTIPDLLRLVPGFQVAYLNANLPVVSVHGSGAPWFARLQVLVDGHSAYNAAFSGIDWSNLGVALEDIERIEIVRGPSIPTYGANAIQGAINIFTRPALSSDGAYLRSNIGSRATRELYFRQTHQSTSNDFQVSGEYKENAGFPERNDGMQLRSFRIQDVYKLNRRDELDLRIGNVENTAGVELHFDLPLQQRNVKSRFGFARWTRIFSNDESLYFQYSVDDYQSRENSRPLASDWLSFLPDEPFSLNHFQVDTVRSDLEMQHQRHFLGRHRLVWGFGYRQDRHASEILQQKTGLRESSKRLFGNLEFRLKQNVINIGGLVENTGLMGTKFSPRIANNWKLTKRDTIRLAATRAYKSPSLQEENWRAEWRYDNGQAFYLWMFSDQNLAPERRDVIDAAYLGRRLGGRLNYELRIYREIIADAVIYAWDETCPQPAPIGVAPCYHVGNYMSYRVNGLETEWNYRIANRTRIHASYALARAEGKIIETLNSSQMFDMGETVPKHNLSLMLNHRFTRGYNASATFYYMGDITWYADGSLIESYKRLDMNVAKKISLAAKSALKIELIAQNLGADYWEYRKGRNPNVFETRVYLRATLLNN